MIHKEDIIEIWHCIQAHEALKQVTKIIAKRDIEDFVIFIRTKRNTFLQGSAQYTDISHQLAQLVVNTAEELNTNPKTLAQEISNNITNYTSLKIEIDDLLSQDNLTEKEVEEEVERLVKAYGIKKERLVELIKEKLR